MLINKGYFIFFFITHTVNNVGMNCADRLAYFLEIGMEQVTFTF